MKKVKRINKKYSPEFKLRVIIDMRENHLGYNETIRKYFNVSNSNASNFFSILKRWERIFLEEGEAGLYIERRGRTTKMQNPNKGRPKLNKQVKQDLIAENQQLKERIEQLEMENELMRDFLSLTERK